MKYLIFNLKANLNYQDLTNYNLALEKYKKEILVAPGYLYLDYFQKNGFKICSQDVSKFPSGNYTGEVSSEQLQNLNCQYTLIGHYERHKYFQESKNEIITKINQALKHKIKVILCLSEETDNYDFNNLKSQIKDIYQSIDINDLNKIIIAYEPSFLISKQSNIDIEKIKVIIERIKKFVHEEYDFKPEFIYGGGITLDNVNDLKKMSIDGLLIGTLSTSLNDILTLMQILRQP